ncbi:MAG: L,D-transpeptidase family protein [Desulfobacca sp.]|uniref:L,D-transpeptidase family protein n=1 Tax=Desulfobacca sp. TaxID=2067990 RepID=UPI00404B2EF7
MEKLTRLAVIALIPGLVLVTTGCGRKKPTVSADLALPAVEEQSPPKPRVDPKFAADLEVVKQTLAKEQPYGNPVILVVRKQSRTMSLFQGTKPVRRYQVVLGHNPRNDKLMQGDRCTPEGVYRVVTKYPHRKWQKFILLDYPTPENWLKFARAKQRGEIPIDAQIGGDIGIHGTDDELKNLLRENWTEGCIALRNGDIEEVYRLVQPGSLVVIRRK